MAKKLKPRSVQRKSAAAGDKDDLRGDDHPGDDDERSPEDWQKLWTREWEAATKELTPWHKQAQEVEKIYLDDRKDAEDTHERKTNMFVADTIDMECLLYGRTPQTDVTRKYEDANDDVARVAAMIMQRSLNGDIERPSDRFRMFAGYALSDHLRTNFGLVRWRYDCRMKQVPAQPPQMRPDPQNPGKMVEAAPAVEAHEEVAWEDAVCEYAHWRDVKWSPCRVWEEARFIGFRVQMTRKQAKVRFKKEGGRIPLNSKRYDSDSADDPDEQVRYPWDRADVWEIWSKEHSKVFWFVEGHDRILDVIDDPLELEDFWPCPKPLVSWITTTRFVPKPEYLIAQDLYRSIEHLETRIDMLVSSLRVLGVYDENFQELGKLLDSTEENTMIPVANWTSVAAEKGGLEGAVSWFPLDQVVNTLEQLRLEQQAKQQMLQEITGRADVQRGRLENPGETATATRAKTKFASKRIQRKQDMFAEFVSDAQRIRAEIIAKHFSDDTIRERSNIDRTDDAQYADEAIKLIREEGIEGYRITVKSESLSLPDYEEMQSTGTQFMTAMSGVVESLVKLPPLALPILPELATALKWYATRFRGTTEIQSAMDRLVKKMQKLADNPPQQQGDQGDQAKVQAQQLKNQGDQQRIQMEGQLRMQEIQAETHAEVVKQEAQAKFDGQTQQQELQGKLVLEREKQRMEAEREQHQSAVEQQGQREQHGMQMQVEGVQHEHELQRGQAEAQRQNETDLAAHERSIEADKLKAKSGIEQLRMKGQQAKEQVKLKGQQAAKKPAKEKKK